VVVSAQEYQHRDGHCKSSVSIAIMSWHMHKNIVMRAVNLYNKFAWDQEILMRAIDEKQVISL